MFGTINDSLAYKKAIRLLFLLLSFDFGFILLDLFHEFTPYLNDLLFSITEDFGIAEIYGYFKWLAITIVLVCLVSATSNKRYYGWALLFAYFLMDDMLSLHERGGWHISNIMGRPHFGLSMQDSGELIFSAIMGTLILGCLGYNYIKGKRHFKTFSHNIILLVIALVFFGVFVDLFRELIEHKERLYYALGLVEDGGELLVASFMLGFTYYMLQLHLFKNESVAFVKA